MDGASRWLELCMGSLWHGWTALLLYAGSLVWRNRE